MASHRPPKTILAIDIGGSNMKILVTGQTERRRAPTGRTFTPQRLIEVVAELAKDWEYEAISVGYPGPVGDHGPRSEAGNLGPGWVGFNFAAAFDKPVRIVNDAAMQALGCYEGGRMLFLGLGTGLGSALIADNVIIQLELGRVRGNRGRRLGRVLSDAGRKAAGNRLWRRAVARTVADLRSAFLADDVVIGGGNAKLFRDPPSGARLGNNLAAFRGGFRLWHIDDVPTHDGTEEPPPSPDAHESRSEWRLI
ncbi:MAG TPA: ROK family protein [Gemmataceae bacterium]|jgi:predicted NBD/HSP70 family sugar kinase|nr:ROK family protein [Gemmataceae bacterium]